MTEKKKLFFRGLKIITGTFGILILCKIFLKMDEKKQAGPYDDESIQRINFQVYGKVTGVFFRKYTKLEAKKLELTGWVRNVREGEVQGSIEGTPEKLEVMIHWLRHQGSPKSKIERVVFADPVEVKGEVKPFHSFEVIK